ncbi:hypothetical protein BU14_0502s0003 [Porphyra umbilicalis]|uniref:Uncharacterized protein n=1 Tax=Porphyra umbilicalis TaxID=2786 RepID=A0A1X6NT05_PORUM|nr:hypothetical protein BU14_0502s0003 [Porphyra umbilicalis]|eukprot:OSX71769.1 hypothetical protein BU14_0502s0003 [Porphyra umbilicalis]
MRRGKSGRLAADTCRQTWTGPAPRRGRPERRPRGSRCPPRPAPRRRGGLPRPRRAAARRRSAARAPPSCAPGTARAARRSARSRRR